MRTAMEYTPEELQRIAEINRQREEERQRILSAIHRQELLVGTGRVNHKNLWDQLASRPDPLSKWR